MIKELAEDIRAELFKKIDTMYNYRKLKEGLVSVHNQQLDKVKRILDEWVCAEGIEEKAIQQMSIRN